MFSKGINLPSDTLESAMKKIIFPEKNICNQFKEALKNSNAEENKMIKHNNKKCNVCMSCIIHCNGKALKLDSPMYGQLKVKYIVQKCLMCDDCDAIKACKNGCFEVVK